MRFLILLAIFLTLQDEQAANHISPKAESAISRFVKAKGGMSALKKIENYSIKGEVVSGSKIVGKFEIYQTANRHLFVRASCRPWPP